MNHPTVLPDINRISFPGLWDGEFTINETAFSIGNLAVAWYGILITAGIVLAVWYIYRQGKKSGLVLDDLLDITLFTVIPGIIGARLYYVFFDWLRYPDSYQSFFDVINIRGGGLAIYGGILFGAAACIITLRCKKIRIPAFFDCLAPAVMLAQSIGRWGNFCNGEAFGSNTTLPWAMRIESQPAGSDVWYTVTSGAHPTFLYESLWNLAGFILLSLLFKRRKFDGQIALGYFTWYGFGRMFIEGLRTDSLYIGSTGIRVSQLLAFLFFIVAGSMLVWLTFFKFRTRTVAGCIYLPGAKALANSPDGPDAANGNAPSDESGESTGPDAADTDAKVPENTENTGENAVPASGDDNGDSGDGEKDKTEKEEP